MKTDIIEHFSPAFAIGVVKNTPQMASFGMRSIQSETKTKIVWKMVVFVLVLSVIASIFQTLAWYHNSDGNSPFWTGVGLSMLFVTIEYMCIIPANQIGNRMFSLFQLAILIEFISWSVFTLYILYVRKEEITKNCWIGLGIIFIGVVVAYL